MFRIKVKAKSKKKYGVDLNEKIYL